jgi:hypothetical protein
MPVGRSTSISSCTTTLQHAIVDNPPPLEGRRVIIVDTPGFKNTYMNDEEILLRITGWLKSSYVAILSCPPADR